LERRDRENLLPRQKACCATERHLGRSETQTVEAKKRSPDENLRKASPFEKTAAPQVSMDPEGETPWAGPALTRLAGIGRMKALGA
jgi:hypothetical protein